MIARVFVTPATTRHSFSVSNQRQVVALAADEFMLIPRLVWLLACLIHTERDEKQGKSLW
jgi:hypothetical protein